ncbi:MAG: prepilin-type N-terminal cleavage/methylation domain-containing protein [Desulfobacterales bacterium]|jgi:prepilin-type N-terminal cleavage/methylation domain-containing protein
MTKLVKVPFYEFKLQNNLGFTLIEMAVVLVIGGIIISIMATVLPSLLQAGKIKKSQAILERVDYAIQGYITATGRFPCPDINLDGKEDREDGNTPGNPADDRCPQYVGEIPYLTLGLSSGEDVWGNSIRYGIYNDLVTMTTTTGSNPLCNGVDEIIRYYDPQNDNNLPNNNKLYITDVSGSNPKNVAYILVSGGMRDLDDDGADSFFDGFNEGSDLHFDSPNRIGFYGDPVSRRYDDLVRVASFSYIKGIAGCVGTNLGTIDTSSDIDSDDGSNHDNSDDDNSDDDNSNDDGSDDDSHDSKQLIITTAKIPSGSINSSYGVTIQASGGVNTYEWTLVNNGGFANLFLHPYTGALSGSLNQCAGDYTISVQVKDSTPPADGGPQTATKSFTLRVDNNLNISPQSSSGTDITWSISSQQESFKAYGGHVGDIGWQLQTGGATGFTISAVDGESCVISKSGTTTTGTYAFTLTATDSSCPGNTADLVLSVTVQTSAGGMPGDITGIIDTLEFDTSVGLEPFIFGISEEVFAIAYSGPGTDGHLKTMRIGSDGSITDPQIDTLEFDPSYAHIPRVVAVADDIFAIAYRGPDNDGWLKTVQISSDGQITDIVIDSLEFDVNYAYAPDIINVSGNYFAIAYRGPDNDGWLKTVEISADGQITDIVIDSLEFDPSNGLDPDIFHISEDVFALAFSGPGNDGWLKTIRIANDGSIADPQVDTLEFDTSYGLRPKVVKVEGIVYAIAYRGPGNDGWLKTVQIDNSGQINGAAIDSLEFDTSNGLEPCLIDISGNFYAVAYSGEGNDGWLKTIEIADDGQITDEIVKDFEFDTAYAYWPTMIHAAESVYVIAYRGPGNDGWLKTVGITR